MGAEGEQDQGLTWIINATSERFNNFDAYVDRLIELRWSSSDRVLEAQGAISHHSTKPPRPRHEEPVEGVITMSIAPGVAMRRVASQELCAMSATPAQRVKELQQEVETVLLQVDASDGVLLTDLQRLRADIQRLTSLREAPFVAASRTATSDDDVVVASLALDTRLSELERDLDGESIEHLEALAADIEARLAPFSDTRVDAVATRCRGAIAQMRLLSREASSATPTTRSQLDELRDTIRRWDDVADSVPILTTRLMTLKTVHERAATVVNLVGNLERRADCLEETLAGAQSAMATIEQSVAYNMDIMQRNCKLLSDRLQALEDRRSSS